MHTVSSASRTGKLSRSASEYTRTNEMSKSRHARMMRSAISPRFAMRSFFTMSKHDHSTVDFDSLPGHIRGIFAHEEGDCSGDILDRTGASHGDLIEHPGAYLVGQFIGHVGVDQARSHDVHGDATCRHFTGHALRQADETRF